MSVSINLVQKDIPFLDKFVAWALTIGRFLVIITEIVALSAFIYRFSLDRELIDLHSKIKQQQLIVNYFKSNEYLYRDLQDRLALSSTFSKAGNNTIQIFKDIAKFASKDVILNNFGLYRDRIVISANASSTSSLTSFTNSLKSYKQIQSVSIDSIENKITSGLIVVHITAFLKEETNGK